MIKLLLKIGYLRSTSKKLPDSYSFWQVHHYGSGWVALTLCFYLLFQLIAITPMVWVMLLIIATAVSLWVVIDDIVQHIAQYLELRKNNWEFYTIVSFWHYFPYWLSKKIGMSQFKVV